MPLRVQNLDDRTYADLVEEAISMIPRYAPEWTNYNPSDPGVTLIELLAYFTEMMIYRLNRVTRESRIGFLKLLRGVDPAEEKRLAHAPVRDVDEALRQAVLDLRRPQRAVSGEDFEYLARTLEVEGPAGPKIVRALCLLRRNLEPPVNLSGELDHPGHVSVVVLPDKEFHHDELEKFLDLVRNELERKRLLTTRLHVTGPHYLFTSVGAEIHILHGVPAEEVRNDAIKKLNDYFDPFPGGGPDGEGWPFGRAIHISEIYEQLENVEGVAFIREVCILNLATSGSRLAHEHAAIGIQIGIHSTVGVDTRLGCLTPADTERLITDTSGRLMAVRLRPHELARIDCAGLAFSSVAY